MAACNKLRQPHATLLGEIHGLDLRALNHQILDAELGHLKSTLNHLHDIRSNQLVILRLAQCLNQLLTGVGALLKRRAQALQKSFVLMVRMFFFRHSCFSEPPSVNCVRLFGRPGVQ